MCTKICKSLTAYVITGVLFVTRTYIKSKISFKEIEMSKYFSEFIQKMSDKQDARFDRQDELIDKKFAEQDARFAEQNARFDRQDLMIEQKFASQTEEIKRLLGK